MNSVGPFEVWVVNETGISVPELEQLKLTASLDVYVSRLEMARQRGAEDPLATISPHGAGGNSRACTRSMLAQLGYTRVELRVVHRLMAGSASGWPGLIKLYATGLPLSAAQREYVHRQVHLVTRCSAPSAAAQRAQDAS